MRIYYLLTLLLISGLVNCQTKIGNWRDHFPYYKSTNVLVADNKVYCIADNNLFYYNIIDRSVNKLNKVKGLSDVSVTAIQYKPEMKMLVIGYENGNIDILDNDGIFNINGIERKQVAGSKRINNIHIVGNNAFLATGFAVVVLDLEKKEIKDTYYLGENGGKEEILDITSDEQFFYALRKDVILKAEKSSPYLIDYNRWQQMYPVSYDNAEYKCIEYFSGKLFCIMTVTGWANDTIYQISEESKNVYLKGYKVDYYNLKSKNNKLIISGTYTTRIINSGYVQEKSADVEFPSESDIHYSGTMWIASSEGLISVNGSQRDTIIPDGPKHKGVYDFKFIKEDMWVAGATTENYWGLLGIHKFSDNKWITIDNRTDTSLAKKYIRRLAFDPNDPTHFFGGTNNSGLIEFKNSKVIKIYNHKNSIIKPIDYIDGIVRVSGMDFDSKGNLFFCSNGTNNPIYVLTPDGNLINLELDDSGLGSRSAINDLMVTSNDHVWVLINKGGFYIIDINGTPEDQSDDLGRYVGNVVNQGGDDRKDVYSIVEDLDNEIWVGTDKGPIIFSDHEYFVQADEEQQTKNIIGYQTTLPDTKDLVQYLLVADKINCIAVDGANRKWLGTENSGVFLVSPNGNKQIHNFRKENSPLPSNEIISIGINETNGEVFFGTGYGIISYRAEATTGSDDFGHVYVFPNPIRSGYEGKIAITGLARDVNVKITDISGNMVYETKALGGQAVWDGKNFDGKRVHTGVYLVFCSNDDGSKTYVTKMVFIH